MIEYRLKQHENNAIYSYNSNIQAITLSGVVQWLRIHLAMQGDVGMISDQGIRIPHVGQLSPCAAQLLSPPATTGEPSSATEIPPDATEILRASIKI